MSGTDARAPAIHRRQRRRPVERAGQSGCRHTDAEGVSQPTGPLETVLIDSSGVGSSTTRHFAAGGNWWVLWSYDCSNVGHASSFQLTVYLDTGEVYQPTDQSLPNETGAGGSGAIKYGTHQFAVHRDLDRLRLARPGGISPA